jgi:protein-S-isoprenylcysteine O-methyltransferase Ste14
MVWRILPLIGVVLLLTLTCCLRPLLQRLRYGTFGISLFQSGSMEQNFRDALLIVFFLVIVGQAIAEAAGARSGVLLVSENGLVHTTLRILGAIIMLCGIGLMAVAQIHLGSAWRIGIEESASPGLETGGLYRYSRNPIYLGLLIAVIGYAMLLPTALSLVLLLGTYIGMRMQTAAEEAYLLRTYGESYRIYAQRVGRFLPRFGKP